MVSILCSFHTNGANFFKAHLGAVTDSLPIAETLRISANICTYELHLPPPGKLILRISVVLAVKQIFLRMRH